MVQWLRPGTSTAGDMGLIPGWGTKILHPTWILHPTRCTVWPQKRKKRSSYDEERENGKVASWKKGLPFLLKSYKIYIAGKSPMAKLKWSKRLLALLTPESNTLSHFDPSSLFFNFYLCIFYFWLCWAFTVVCGFSLVVIRGYSLAVVHGLLIALASPAVEHGL